MIKLNQTTEAFIVHWGEMGATWGVNRSVAQIHALLYLSQEPLHAEQISVLLGMARSNVSTSIKELLNWRLIDRTHVFGDRRDHYTGIKDNWDIVLRIAQGRKRREIDPTLHMLKNVASAPDYGQDTSTEQRKQISELIGFMETTTKWFDDIITIPQPKLVRLMKMGAKITKFIK